MAEKGGLTRDIAATKSQKLEDQGNRDFKHIEWCMHADNFKLLLLRFM